MGSWTACGPFDPDESRQRSLGELEALESEEDLVRVRERLQSALSGRLSSSESLSCDESKEPLLFVRRKVV